MKMISTLVNKKVVLTLLISLLFLTNASIVQAETLTYKVYYGPICLGTVKFHVNLENQNEDSLNTERAIAQTNPLLFFISFYGDYESKFLSDGRSRLFIGTEYSGGDTLITIYDFNHEDSLIARTIREHSDSSITKSDTIKLQGPTYDGIAAIHYVRSNIVNPGKSIIYSLYEDNYGAVVVNVTDRVEKIAMESLNGVFNARLVKGEIRFKGMAGWSGKYETWVSNDDKAFILKAKVKIFLGSIQLYLASIEN